ncbi:MAG: glycyl-radical enzyme activating protein [Ignavibacteria bacterium]
MPTKALIFDIQDLSVQDGPGIRTTVFMKGCPLKCKWCSNPEGQKPYPELMHIHSLCKKSQNCIKACPYNAVSISDSDGFPNFNRNICKDCQTRECVDSCPTRAIKFVGRYLSLEELIKKVKPNISFYKNSGGGVTFSGGEPFLQTEFIKEFINETLSFGLSVGIETCGMFDWSEVRNIAGEFDFFYFDLKCMDNDIHKSVTGSTNEKILTNLKNLAELYSEKITVSIPVIPDVNESDFQVKSIAEFCKQIGIKKIRLLPYHSLGESKYSDLGREYTMNKDLAVSTNRLNEYKSLIESYGIKCWVE